MGSDAEIEIDLRKYIGILLHYWYLIAGSNDCCGPGSLCMAVFSTSDLSGHCFGCCHEIAICLEL